MRADLHGNWNGRLQEDLKILGADPNLSTGRTFMDITSQRLSDFFSPLHLKHKKKSSYRMAMNLCKGLSKITA